jgi:uncharacterized delta-60 repeat protein
MAIRFLYPCFIIIGIPFIWFGELRAQDGSLDFSFNPGTGFNDYVYSILLQPDGKILAGGHFTSYNGVGRHRIIRLNENGTVDNTFLASTGGGVFAMALQNDGKILLGGSFISCNGLSSRHLARLNSDGTLDTNFAIGTGFNGHVYDIVLQPNGQIIVGGDFDTINDIGRRNIARLHADGSLDSSFNTSQGIGGINTFVFTAALQNDGKVLIGGGFDSFDGVYRKNLARLNEDGSLDLSFNPVAGPNNIVNALAIQQDGRIVIGGVFTSYNGTITNRVTRLSDDGSLDQTFINGAGANLNVTCLHIQSDDKILIGGLFNQYNNTNRSCIARLNFDGTLDSDFNPGFGVLSVVSQDGTYNLRTIVQQEDGKLLIGGKFTFYNGTARRCIARINNSVTGISKVDRFNDVKLYPNPAKQLLIIEPVEHLTRIEIFDISGRSCFQRNAQRQISAIIDISQFLKGSYFVRLYFNDGENVTRKLMVVE